MIGSRGPPELASLVKKLGGDRRNPLSSRGVWYKQRSFIHLHEIIFLHP